MAFPPEVYDTNCIKVDCTYVHVPWLSQGRHWDATEVATALLKQSIPFYSVQTAEHNVKFGVNMTKLKDSQDLLQMLMECGCGNADDSLDNTNQTSLTPSLIY